MSDFQHGRVYVACILDRMTWTNAFLYAAEQIRFQVPTVQPGALAKRIAIRERRIALLLFRAIR